MLSGKMEKDICNVCRRESNMECEVCGDSYCSKECQRLDYKRHRYICFPLPALKPSGEKQECENCKRLAVDCCDRCGFGYCSRKCQIENWECHRYICAPMPKLIKKTRVAVEQFEKAPAVRDPNSIITSPTVSNAIRHNEMQITRAAEQKQGETSAAPTSKPLNSFASRQDAYEKTRGADNKAMQQQRAPTSSQHIPKSPNESNNTFNSSSNNNTQTQKPNTKFQRAEENAFVRCMGFSALNCIYLRNTNPDTDKEFSDIIKKIDEFGRNQHMPLKLSQLNAKNTVLVNVDDQWYRARVLERPESANNIPVQLLDLGEQRIATIKEIAGLSGEINALPIHTYYMYLRNVPKVPLKEKMKNFVMDFVGSTFKVKYNQPDKNGSKLELYPIGGGQKTFNQMILEFLFESEKDKMLGGNAEQQFVNGNERGGRADENNRNPNKTTAATRSIGNNKLNGFENRKPDNQNQTGSNSDGNKMYENRKNERAEVSRASAAPAKESTPPPDMEMPRVKNEVPFKLVTLESDLNELAVTVLDYSNISNGFFGCIPKNLGVQLVDIQTFLGKMDIDAVPYKPKLNEYCLAMFEEEWYRAKCTKIEGPDSFKLFYIDFTNEETLSSKDIRKYPKECKFDCNTFVCVLSNFPKVVTPEQVKFAEDYFANNKFIKLNNIKCIEAPFYSADCFEVVQK